VGVSGSPKIGNLNNNDSQLWLFHATKRQTFHRIYFAIHAPAGPDIVSPHKKIAAEFVCGDVHFIASIITFQRSNS